MRIFYDGECPFCSRYVGMLRLREAAGPVELINLREAQADRERLLAEGFDLDGGMVVETEGRKLGGADAVNALAMMTTPLDAFNKLNARIMASPAMAAALYPVLRSGRWLTLFLLGRKGLTDEDDGTNARARIFGIFFALFSMFHVGNYSFAYDRFPPSLDLVAVLLSAILLLTRPGSSRALFLLMLASTISTIVQMPMQSNHTIVRAAAVLGYWAAFIWAMVRGRPGDQVFAGFAPAGQAALIVMYFFGIFHKINTDFLNPLSSCATALWAEMPAPLAAIDGTWMQYLAIYGTFIVEGAMIVALLIPRLRHYGIACGICFHLLLSLSGFAMYISFTTLTISLHMLFLSPAAARRVWTSPELTFLRSRLRHPSYIALVAVLVMFFLYSAATGQFNMASLSMFPLVLPICWAVLRHGDLRPDDAPDAAPARRAGRVIGLTVFALFMFNGFMPYLGLKSAQTINMFSNLRLEGGVSNHLVFPNPPGPFAYLDDVALVTDAGGDDWLAWQKANDYGIVYYDLLARLADNPDLRVSYTVNGVPYDKVTAADVKGEIDSTLHSPWVRKFFHFQLVKQAVPEPCHN